VNIKTAQWWPYIDVHEKKMHRSGCKMWISPLFVPMPVSSQENSGKSVVKLLGNSDNRTVELLTNQSIKINTNVHLSIAFQWSSRRRMLLVHMVKNASWGQPWIMHSTNVVIILFRRKVILHSWQWTRMPFKHPGPWPCTGSQCCRLCANAPEDSEVSSNDRQDNAIISLIETLIYYASNTGWATIKHSPPRLF